MDLHILILCNKQVNGNHCKAESLIGNMYRYYENSWFYNFV